MLGLLTRKRNQPTVTSRRRVGLRVERLEGRDCPSVAPQITGLTATPTSGTGTQVTITGQLTENAPGEVSITFGGVVSGAMEVNSSGTFTYSTHATKLGAVTAVAVELNETSNTAQAKLTCPAPVITSFCAVDESGPLWDFEGHVNDPNPQGLVVVLGGLPTLQNEQVTATCDANGNFSVVVQLQPNETGTATANVTDPWGQQAATAYYFVP
jgi:hypothetical protein